MSTTYMGLWGTVSLIACVWVIYEVWGVNKGLSGGAKLIWTLAALFFGPITAIAYYLIEKNRKNYSPSEDEFA